MEKLESLKTEEKLKRQLLNEWFLNKEEYKKVWVKKIKENVYAVWNKNLWFYLDENWNTIFDLVWIYKDLWQEKYTSYLKKLWYKEVKDQNWYYHMINLKTWKEISQTSIEYYEIFRELAFVDDKQRIISTLKPEDLKVFMERWRTFYKQIADILEDMTKEWRFYFETIQTTQSISPLEYFSYLSLWLIEKQDILKYTKQVFNLDYFEKYYNNEWSKLLEDKKFKILLWEWKGKYDGERILFERYKVYEISLKPSIENIDLILGKVLPFVEKLELANTKDKQEQEKIKQRYEELREFLKKEKEKLKQKQEVKQKISSLGGNVNKNH